MIRQWLARRAVLRRSRQRLVRYERHLIIVNAIRDFPWGAYGLDMVPKAQSEWAYDLATSIQIWLDGKSAREH